MPSIQRDHRANLNAALQQSMLLEPFDELRGLRQLVRILSILLAGLTAFKLMLGPAVLILTTESSLIAKAAMLGKHPLEVGVLLLGAAAALGLYILQLIMAPTWLHRRAVAKGTVFALLGTSVIWFYLLTASCRMDADALPVVLLLNAVCCVGFALVLALGLNGELARAVEGSE